jgi:hypothetical protein
MLTKVVRAIVVGVISSAIALTPIAYAQPLPGYTQQPNSTFTPPPPDSQPSLGSGPTGALSQAQLGALVAPIALYPDALLAQVLIASTYPLEVAEAEGWLRNNPKISQAEREQAIKVQPWDNSVKSLIDFPDALNLMGKDLAWTQKLGDAYLAQPKELFQAVQTLRAKAQAANNLKSGPQQTVATQMQSGQQVIVIEPTNPQVVYVPAYNPYLVYGPWPYPGYYPPPFYPYAYSPGGLFFSFGIGLAVGAAFWATPHWGSGSVVINNVTYNNFNRSYNTPGNMGPSHYGQNSDWKYNPAHRANVPYTNSVLSNRFSNTPAIQQARMQESRQQSAKNFWSQNSSQQEKQNLQQVHQNAQKAWNNASPQQHQNVQNPRSNVTRMRSAAPSSNSRPEGGEGFGGREGGGEFHGGGFRR